jgi:hypothetical protein
LLHPAESQFQICFRMRSAISKNKSPVHRVKIASQRWVERSSFPSSSHWACAKASLPRHGSTALSLSLFLYLSPPGRSCGGTPARTEFGRCNRSKCAIHRQTQVWWKQWGNMLPSLANVCERGNYKEESDNRRHS